MSRGRLEAFSDGVIAVAITLLVLDIHVPQPGVVSPSCRAASHTLACELGRAWPAYAAYATSFITIGIIWINHHAMISRLREADRMILFLNLLLLLFIALLPFATSLMATYLKLSRGQHLAAAIYGGSFLAMAVFFAALNRHILIAKPHLHVKQLSLERRRQILGRSVAGLVPYAVATALASVSALVTLVICAAVAAFYALPIGSGGVEED